MIVRLILNYLKKRKREKDIKWLNEYVESHPVEKIEPSQKEIEEDNDITIDLNLTDSIDLLIDSEKYTLSKEHIKNDWEDDDILLSKSTKGSVFIHPWTFLQYVISSKCEYLKNQNSEFIENINNSKWLSFSYLEDSRDYPAIKIENKKY